VIKNTQPSLEEIIVKKINKYFKNVEISKTIKNEIKLIIPLMT
jgi:hypothetical protein